MPKLPDATVLNNVSPSAVRSFTNIPVADYAGLGVSLGQAVSNVGQGLTNYADTVYKKRQAQERFDTRLKLLDGEQAYNDRVKDLDPLDPDYVEKVKAARKETILPIVQGVQDPENQQYFAVSTKEDYVKLGQAAEGNRRDALGKDATIKIGVYADTIRKKIRSGEYAGDPIADVYQMIDDNQYLTDLEREALKLDTVKGINADQADAEFESFATSGVAVTPDVRKAITDATSDPNVPSWMASYLARSATIESHGGRNKINEENPDVVGTWQIATATAKDLGLSPNARLDDAAAAQATVKLTMRNFNQLKEALGRDPTPGELYLAHQQGAGGAISLLTKPDAKAADVLGNKAVEMNLPQSLRDQAKTVTAAQFAQMWTGKFDRADGMVEEQDALAILKGSTAYQRMTADEQDAAEKSVIARTKSINEENKKTIDIETARNNVDYVTTNFEDRNKAADYIKENIKDPATREKALTMLTAEYNRIDENAKASYKELVGSTYNDVLAALDKGDPAAALRAIPQNIDGKDRAELLKIIQDGRATVDDPEVYNKIQALKLGPASDREAFTQLDLRQYQGRLKSTTIDALAKEQESLKKQIADTGTAPGLDTAATMLDQRLREIGIDVSPKATGTDLRYTREIRSIMSQNLDNETRRLGRSLTPVEVQKVMDDTFLTYRGKKPGAMWGTTEADLGVKDILDKFAKAEETLKMPPGALVAQATRELNADLAAARADIDAKMAAFEKRARSIGNWRQSDVGIEYAETSSSYADLAEQKADLDSFTIDAATLNLWYEKKRQEMGQ